MSLSFERRGWIAADLHLGQEPCLERWQASRSVRCWAHSAIDRARAPRLPARVRRLDETVEGIRRPGRV